MEKILQHIQKKKKFLNDLLIKEWKTCKMQVSKLILIIQLIVKGKTTPKHFVGFKDPLGFYRKVI